MCSTWVAHRVTNCFFSPDGGELHWESSVIPRFPYSSVNTRGSRAIFHTEILPIVFIETPGQERGSTFRYATLAPHLPLTSSTVFAQKPWRRVGWFILLQLLDFHFYYLTWDGRMAWRLERCCQCLGVNHFCSRTRINDPVLWYL